MKAVIVIAIFTFYTFTWAKEVLILPQEKQDAYALLKEKIAKSHTSIVIQTPFYDYKNLNYHLIKQSKKGVKVTLILNKQRLSKASYALDLYQNIQLCYNKKIPQKSYILLDDTQLFVTTLNLSSKSFQNKQANFIFYNSKYEVVFPSLRCEIKNTTTLQVH